MMAHAEAQRRGEFLEFVDYACDTVFDEWDVKVD
jgi:hypothetical protein